MHEAAQWDKYHNRNEELRLFSDIFNSESVRVTANRTMERNGLVKYQWKHYQNNLMSTTQATCCSDQLIPICRLK